MRTLRANFWPPFKLIRIFSGLLLIDFDCSDDGIDDMTDYLFKLFIVILSVFILKDHLRVLLKYIVLHILRNFRLDLAFICTNTQIIRFFFLFIFLIWVEYNVPDPILFDEEVRLNESSLIK